MHFSNLEYCEILPKVNARKRLIIALSLPRTLCSLFMANFSRLVLNAFKYATWSQGAIIFEILNWMVTNGIHMLEEVSFPPNKG